MKIPDSVKTFLSQQQGQFRGVVESDAPEESRVVSQLVRSKRAFLLLITTSGSPVDIDKLSTMLKCEVTEASLEDLDEGGRYDEFATVVPFPHLYNTKAVIDSSVLKLDEIYLASGAQGIWIKSSKRDYLPILKGMVKVASLSVGSALVRQQIIKKVKLVDKFPPMPGLAAQIMRVKNNPYATSAELVSIISQDPSLAAQIIRYANASQTDEILDITDLERAVDKVLGFDFVIDFSFGLALSQPLKIAKSGPLGLDAFWRDALATASIVQGLIKRINFSSRPSVSTGYLAGLIHNIGLLLLGHLFPAQHEIINRVMADNPDRDLLQLEEEFLGINHIELGEQLMALWDMPSEIIDVVSHHQEAGFRSENGSRFANIVHVAEQALYNYDRELELMDGLTAGELDYISVSEDVLHEVVHAVMGSKKAIEEMASKMVA